MKHLMLILSLALSSTQAFAYDDYRDSKYIDGRDRQEPRDKYGNTYQDNSRYNPNSSYGQYQDQQQSSPRGYTYERNTGLQIQRDRGY